MNRQQATEAILAAKKAKGLTFDAIAQAVGRHKVWVTSALLGQATMSGEEAAKAVAVLANWFVCLAVWMAVRVKSETARILMIWWCMFTFITSGYEHSIANMCGLLIGLLLPHGEAVSWTGYWYNLSLATTGNVIGGAVFVAGLYWVGSPKARAVAAAAVVKASANGYAAPDEPVPVPATE